MSDSATWMGNLLCSIAAVGLYLSLARPDGLFSRGPRLWQRLSFGVFLLAVAGLILLVIFPPSPEPPSAQTRFTQDLAGKLVFLSFSLTSVATAASAVLASHPRHAGSWLIGHLFCNAVLCLVAGFPAGFIALVLFNAVVGLPVLIIGPRLTARSGKSVANYEPALAAFACGLWLMLWTNTLAPPMPVPAAQAWTKTNAVRITAPPSNSPDGDVTVVAERSPSKTARQLLARQFPTIVLLLLAWLITAVTATRLIHHTSAGEPAQRVPHD